MKINCFKKDLERVISKVGKITTKNLNLPILKGLLFDVDNKILIKATNLDIGIELEVSGQIKNKGKIVVDGGVIETFISNIPGNENLNLESKGNSLFVTNKNIKTTIPTIPIDDFPIIPKPKNGQNIKINPKIFIDGLKSVWHSSSNSNIKPELSSVYVYPDGEKIIFVATDSFRLSEKKIPTKETINFEPILIPIKNIGEIIKNLEDLEDEIEIIFEDNQVSFIIKDGFLTSRIINGSFPDYKQIIPKEIKTEVITLKEDIINSLKLTNIFADKFNQIIFNVLPSKKQFIIKSKNQEKGENISIIDSTQKGDDLEIGFNYRYIMDSFQSILSDSISFSLSGPSKPMLIKGVSDNTFTYIVMPMNK